MSNQELESRIQELEKQLALAKQKYGYGVKQEKKESVREAQCSICGILSDTKLLVRMSQSEYVHKKCLPVYTPPAPTKKRVIHIVFTAPLTIDTSLLLENLRQYNARVLTDRVVEN